MSSSVDLVDVGEAARLLDVSTRQVARLGRDGEIRYLARGVVERASIDAYLRERQFSRTRPWSTETAWAAVGLLSGVDVDWLGQVQMSRLRGRLRELADSIDGGMELVGRARARAVVRSYEAQDFLVRRLRHDVVLVDRTELGLAGPSADHLDGYLAERALTTAEATYGLRPDSSGRLVLRATSFDLTIVRSLATSSGVLAALDAAGSNDPRQRGIGARSLTGHLQSFARRG